MLEPFLQLAIGAAHMFFQGMAAALFVALKVIATRGKCGRRWGGLRLARLFAPGRIWRRCLSATVKQREESAKENCLYPG